MSARIPRLLVRTGLVLALHLLVARPAHATSGDCVRAPDGTPCRSDCRVGGTCQAGTCVGGSPDSDGTSCATGLFCTTGDTCKGGICQAGPPVVCGVDPNCGPAHCVERVGCVPVVACDMAHPVDLAGLDLVSPPDLVGEVIDANMDNPKPDLAVQPDLGVPVDLADPPVGDGPVNLPDLAGPDDGGPEDLSVNLDGGLPPDGGGDDLADVPDGGVDTDADVVPPDADVDADPDTDLGVDEDGDVLGMHVHGSGCGVTGRAPAGVPVGLLLLGVLVLLLRRPQQ